MSRATKDGDSLVLGGVPRVHLLPPQIESQKRTKALRRSLLIGLVGVVVLVAVGIGAATIGLLSANAALAAEQVRSNTLLAAQSKYGKVVQIQNQVRDIKAAQPLATNGEIAWDKYISALQSTLPAGMEVKTVHAQLATAAETATGATALLVGAHVATLNLTVDTPTMPISDWLDSLRSLTGFVDATPGSVVRDDATGHYTVEVELHISKDALSNRFQKATN